MMDDRPRVYMAGPVQHSDDAEEWREKLVRLYACFEWVNPLAKYNALDDVHIDYDLGRPGRNALEQAGHEVVSAGEIVRSDVDMIKSCDALLARLDGSPMTGTPMEMRIAYSELNIPVVVWRTNNERSPWSWRHCDACRKDRVSALNALALLLDDDEDSPVPRSPADVIEERRG
jgi:nucleoside 2-deoxyribosyltransferase